MQEQTSIDKAISDFIYRKPEIVVSYLKQSGYKVSSRPTLEEIVDKTFRAIYEYDNKRFAELLDAGMSGAEHNNFIVAALSAGMAVAGMFAGSRQAKKARDLQAKIAMAQLSTEKELGLESIRTQAETARTEILLNSLASYRSNLQSESTKRLRDVWIYTGIMAAGVALIYGTFTLLKTSVSWKQAA